eukprot:TRINITY_DN3962_c0_g1_i16.p1 TRINITY_DN3962_c0_g1~~TRINITY_DN3962_c0_g1_i16.p1  ORF type:complete len:244 (+),score=38.87 TRINITY_DN3962_c0_g1_i16:648-1379(+)
MKELKKLPDGEKYAGELSAAEGKKKLKTVREWIVGLTRVRKNMPAWVPESLFGVQTAQTQWSAEAGSLIRKGAREMLATLDRFMDKDEECGDGEDDAVPATNDFCESAHGTLSYLMQGLPDLSIYRAAQITQFKHNKKALKTLGVSVTPSAEELNVFRKKALPSAASAAKDVYRGLKEAEFRTKLERMPAADVCALAAEHDIVAEKNTKKALLPKLVTFMYSQIEPKSAVPAQERKRRRVASK